VTNSILRVGIGLMRPLNMAITFAAVVMGGLLGKVEPEGLPEVLLAALAAALVAGGANSLNDACDAEIDRRNRPERPVPSGRISPEGARNWGFYLMLAGVLCGFTVNIPAGIVATGVSGLMILYDYRLKRELLWGNLAVALSTGLALYYGALAAGHPAAGIVPGLFAFLINLAREIIKDVEDVAGDRSAGAGTLPIRYGSRGATLSSALVLLILIVVSPLPYRAGTLDSDYARIVLIGVDLPLAAIAIRLFFATEARVLRWISNSLKAVMVIGLAALYAG